MHCHCLSVRNHLIVRTDRPQRWNRTGRGPGLQKDEQGANERFLDIKSGDWTIHGPPPKALWHTVLLHGVHDTN